MVLTISNYLQNYLFDYMNKYETIDTIGEGEYGLVLKAINKETSELVAIKKFKQDDSQPQNKRVILRQVKILKSLNHQNIIQLKQAFRKTQKVAGHLQPHNNMNDQQFLWMEHALASFWLYQFIIFIDRKGKIYLICEFVEKNLLEIIEEETTILPQRLKNFTYQVLKGIAYMHNQNIIHRDIKPENLLISKSDQLKICDLGFARNIPQNGKMTDYVATRWYRPPQLLIGREDYNKSIDIWSIGCVMAEMIDGEPLFGGENDLDQLYLIQKCLGPLIPEHKQFFLKNPKFVGMKFPQIHVMESIDRRYIGKIDKLGLDLLKRMLKMDPDSRITAEEALAHPYFNRVQTAGEREFKKSSIIDLKTRMNEEYEGIDKERGQSHQKSKIHFNNFLQERGLKNREQKQQKDKIGRNKVTGMSKIQKYNQNQSQEDCQSPWIFSGKGKSLGKKPTVQSIREKQHISDKYSRVKLFTKQKRMDNYEDDQYAEEWQQEGDKKQYESSNSHLFHNGIPNSKSSHPQELMSNYSISKEKTDRKIVNDNQFKNFAKQQERESVSKEGIGKQKKKKKLFTKKDNVNIVFNQNTYNLNIIEDPYGY